MEEASCIPGYRNINAQLLYRLQEDYAFVNDIRARKFLYNPYFRKEPEGPYVKEYHEKYSMGGPLNGSVFSPLIKAQQTMNRQCNPFVSYPYGVPRDPPYEKCSKCRGNKKSKKEKREKKEKKRHQSGHLTDHISDHINALFASKLSSPIDYNPLQGNSQHNEENHFYETGDYPVVHYPREGNSQNGNSPYSSFEMTTAHDLEGTYPRTNDVEISCDELERPIENYANYINVDKPEYHYSYNEKANRNSSEKLQKIEEKIFQFRSDPDLSDDRKPPSEEEVNFDVKGEDQFSTMFADSDGGSASPHNAEAQNEAEGFLSQYINDIEKKGPNGRKHQREGSTSGDNPYDTPVRVKRDAEDLYDNEIVAAKMNAQEKRKTPKTLEVQPVDGAKRDKNDKQPIKQVKICEHENVLNKYSVTESCKMGDTTNGRLKVGVLSGRGAHDSNSPRSPRSPRSPHSPHTPHSLFNQRDTERGKASEHYGRVCRQAIPKYEAAKDVVQLRHKRETTNTPQMSTSNEEDKWSAISAKKIAPKYRKGYYPNRDIMTPKKKTEKKELTYKNSKIAIGRTKSLRFRRDTVTFATKNINFQHRKKSILSKQKSMAEPKLKKQNTVALKRRKTMSRLNSMKKPPYTIVLNKKKVINMNKGMHPSENRKDKISGTTNTPLAARRMLARSKTKVLVDNETKIFKKENVKMVSSNPFNPIASSVESSRRNELENGKQKKELGTVGSANKRESAQHLSTNADKKKIYHNSVRNKLKSKKEEMFQNIISLTKNMKEKPLKKKYNDQIDPRDLLSVTSNNSSVAVDDDL
ncbi:conserved Plasmodium protein, unknown function [Plasmodium knowlesi strain H]|uniref:Uncharacterized protein n=3 Tax=Plasmodium knowlesi TaxID=5850 RepID=A0A5K1VKJ8_PLAKH|nr:conserved Plasmodium protein, unknown function [Plasmodium knowlesi strain H]OTN68159.1 Uncharacterized protein PKNOH_S04346900 [Plasmodium knowlesi]CAA9990218.1 conserved Plasmodium protein, unknown function [Plasmodium knowlesi strain H]SBO26844.1 conserved Plasmodium protein, unknown function [Plasmodium knowlesi strain H]SBO28458.1 conserved Plasmodium protein, unknown function [Plasmodium knowlesi strain H]VVS79692.1 conserved Plasmodium protein, unknown function [Plasmodium knowlesi s|eukprot:XP_002258083.1 hypothetical protein, conserved in Plasmodium species [Plasmodium knowlesi strain H]